jgi:oxalate decarboxylase/phosphoglucose isomerase-like protein (cupin superfamily)
LPAGSGARELALTRSARPTGRARCTGTTDAQVLAVFKTSEYQEVSLLDWLTHTPPELVAQHLNIDASVVRQFPNNAPGLMPV